MSLEYDKIKTFIADAERIVKETISEAFYDEIDAYITSLIPTDPPAEPPAEPETDAYLDKLIGLLRDSITYMTFNIGFDILNTVFSNQGFHRVEVEASGKKALFQRQEENLRKTFRQQGWNKLDLALAYMETNKDEFATWTASEEYTLTKDHFINSTKEFNQIYNINNNRLVFMKLRNFQTLVEDFDIAPLIGIDYCSELKAQILADNLSNANKAFLTYLKKAVVFCTIGRGGIELITILNEYGIYETQIESIEQNFKTESTVRESFFNKLIESAVILGKSYLMTCETFLKKNIANYATYAASPAYNSEGSSFVLKGTDKIGII
jgi:hypothetical protein